MHTSLFIPICIYLEKKCGHCVSACCRRSGFSRGAPDAARRLSSVFPPGKSCWEGCFVARGATCLVLRGASHSRPCLVCCKARPGKKFIIRDHCEFVYHARHALGWTTRMQVLHWRMFISRETHARSFSSVFLMIYRFVNE